MNAIHHMPADDARADARADALERLWAVAILLSQGMQAGLAERGLTLARAALMWQLQQDGPITQRALSRALRVTPRNVTGLVDALEADGLVERTAHPTDRRATLVKLTENGVAVARAMRSDQGGFAQVLFEGVAAADVATFTTILDQVLVRIRETFAAAELDADSG